MRMSSALLVAWAMGAVRKQPVDIAREPRIRPAAILGRKRKMLR